MGLPEPGSLEDGHIRVSAWIYGERLCGGHIMCLTFRPMTCNSKYQGQDAGITEGLLCGRWQEYKRIWRLELAVHLLIIHVARK